MSYLAKKIEVCRLP